MTSEEKELIQQNMALLGTNNMSAFLRKMAIDGHVIKLDLPELKELVSLLGYTSNNINQIAKLVNSTGRIYSEDLSGIKDSMDPYGQRRIAYCGDSLRSPDIIAV